MFTCNMDVKQQQQKKKKNTHTKQQQPTTDSSLLKTMIGQLLTIRTSIMMKINWVIEATKLPTSDIKNFDTSKKGKIQGAGDFCFYFTAQWEQDQ